MWLPYYMRVSPIMYFARKSYRYKLVDRDTTGKNVLCTPYLYVLCIWMMAEVHKNKSSWILRVNWDHIDIDCNFFYKVLEILFVFGNFWIYSKFVTASFYTEKRPNSITWCHTYSWKIKYIDLTLENGLLISFSCT